MTTKKAPKTGTMLQNGKVHTGQKGMYVVLGWDGIQSDYPDLRTIAEAEIKNLKIVPWDDNEIVGVVNNKKDAVKLMRSKSWLLRGDCSFYSLKIYLND